MESKNLNNLLKDVIVHLWLVTDIFLSSEFDSYIEGIRIWIGGNLLELSPLESKSTVSHTLIQFRIIMKLWRKLHFSCTKRVRITNLKTSELLEICSKFILAFILFK